MARVYGKLVYISKHLHGEQLLLAAINEQDTLSVSEVGDRFGVAEMLAGDKGRERLASLLCYLGVLTLGGRDATGKFILVIPNLVMRRLYVDRLLEMFLPPSAKDNGRDAAEALYTRGEMQPVCDFIEQTYFRVLPSIKRL